MSFLQRLKRDKKFRMKVFIGFVVLALLIGMQDKKTATESQCNDILKSDGGWWQCLLCPLIPAACQDCVDQEYTQASFDECVSTPGCYAVTSAAHDWALGGADILECWNKFVENDVTFVDRCTAQVQVGEYAYSSGDGCVSGYSVEVSDKLCGETLYKCRAAAPDEPDLGTCTSMQNQIGGLAGDVFPGMHCKTRFYIVAIGGSLLALMMLLAVI